MKMGYRSEVGIKCEEKAYEMLKETCHKINYMPDKIYKEGDLYILWWDAIKWYEEYKDIAAIVNTLDKLDELQDPNDYETTGHGYKFIRLGENDDDVETRENDWDIELWMLRKIDIPDGLEEITER